MICQWRVWAHLKYVFMTQRYYLLFYWDNKKRRVRLFLPTLGVGMNPEGVCCIFSRHYSPFDVLVKIISSSPFLPLAMLYATITLKLSLGAPADWPPRDFIKISFKWEGKRILQGPTLCSATWMWTVAPTSSSSSPSLPLRVIHFHFQARLALFYPLLPPTQCLQGAADLHVNLRSWRRDLHPGNPQRRYMMEVRRGGLHVGSLTLHYLTERYSNLSTEKCIHVTCCILKNYTFNAS